MARINPKLNLNKTPQNADNTSLIFAKNIKLLPDVSISADNAVKKIKHWEGEDDLNPNIVGKIVGVNNKIYFFTHEQGAEPEPPTPELPYIELEYIESSGTQYINTNYNINGHCEINIRFLMLGVSGNYNIFGSNNGNAYNNGGIELWYNNGLFEQVIPSSNSVSAVVTPRQSCSSNTIYNVIVNNIKFQANGNINSYQWYEDYYSNKSFTIFTTHRSNGIFGNSSIKLYSCKIYDNGTIVRDLIPVKRKSDNVICMYDLVSETFFTNAGTGDFIAGPEVQQEVTSSSNWSPDWRNSGGYIDNGGTAWFDSGVSMPNGFKMKAKINCTTPSGDSALISALDTSTNKLNSVRLNAPGYLYIDGGADTNRLVYSNYDFETICEIETSNITNNQYIKVDGISVATASKSISTYPNLNLYIFRNNNNTYPQIINTKLYYLKIYDNTDTLVREMYPAIVNNVPCMYDYITDTYFYNQGTGDLTVSQEVIDASINPTPTPTTDISNIYEYNELTDVSTRVNCAWTYHGGEITGCVTVNNTGEEILTISEYNTIEKVEIKHINLSKCSDTDDESIYTQNPNIPLTNLNFLRYYANVIPNGIYRFYIRYKIRDNFYTSWFPASKDCYTGNINNINTIQGELKYVKQTRDSDKSFVFEVEHLFTEYCNIYESFQIGFIISNDNGTFARIWKTFDIYTSVIYFTLEEFDVQEANIDDFTKINFEIFNSKNVISYKNKLYVSNYEETDFNKVSSNDFDPIYTRIKGISANTDSGVYLDDLKLLKNNQSLDYYNYVDVVNNNNTIAKKVFANINYCVLQDYLCNEILTYVDGSTQVNWDLPQDELESISTYISQHPDEDVFVNNNGYYITCLFIKVGSNYYYLQTPTNTAKPGTTTERKTLKYAKDFADTIFYNTKQNVDSINILNFENSFVSFCDTFLKESGDILGIDDTTNSHFVFNTNDGIKRSEEYYIILTKADSIKRGSDILYRKSTRLCKRSCKVNTSLILSNTSNLDIYNYTSLMPFTGYDFYVHYVKRNGIITNGIKINTTKLNGQFHYYTQLSQKDYNYNEGSELIPYGTYQGIPNTEITGSGSTFKNYIKCVDANNNVLDYKELITFDKDTKLYYPSFINIHKPKTTDDYVACFFSMVKYENKVCQGFNHTQELISGSTYKHKIECLEFDTLLYRTYINISIYKQNGELITKEAKYIASGNVNDLGNVGYIEWSGPTISNPTNKYTNDTTYVYPQSAEDLVYWIIINDRIPEEYNTRLVKLTPYIALDEDVNTRIDYDDYKQLNCQSYLCQVEKLKEVEVDVSDTSTPDMKKIYVNSNTVYTKHFDDDKLYLKQYDDRVELQDVNDYKTILSNYNLNYLALTQDVNYIPRTYDDGDKNQIVSVVQSLIASDIYTLPEMYKNTFKHYFYPITNNKLIVFDNTVRTSNKDIDEVYRDIFKFDAEDYYNIPTNRGIIINLFTIINKIYVHTEHSIFVFTDLNMMKVGENLYSSNSNDIALKESDPFSTGVQELFDSQFGYAGLQNKKHSLITFNAYIFYDKLANIIYLYGGESNIIPISDSIYKLLDWFKPTDILFSEDFTNKRFFINLRKQITVNDELVWTNICLSYSFLSKSFVSVHDIDFNESFNSRLNTYFRKTVLEIEDDESVLKDKIYIIDNNHINDYKELKTISNLNLNDVDNLFNDSKIGNCIDVVCNTEYEKVKVLNWINWICSDIRTYNNNYDFTFAEEDLRDYGGSFIRIYTDQTYTELIPLTDSNNIPYKANEESALISNTVLNDGQFEHPRYNCGVWSMNMFRGIKHYEDTYIKYDEDLQELVQNMYPDYVISHDAEEYFTKTKDGVTTRIKNPKNYSDSDNKSLIYGKYFVIRFIFKDKKFKFENVKFNMSDYVKS